MTAGRLIMGPGCSGSAALQSGFEVLQAARLQDRDLEHNTEVVTCPQHLSNGRN